ncbi:SDR family oxidoreductase [Nonomuraea insulae]|uniref:SDR family oxidoreductase n=1 Tax=Nonomuraea insulae TaxID=1616787 RepID=A0ABW1CQN4_9ACTN
MEAFDAEDMAALERCFSGLAQVGHVMVTVGRPHYRPPLEMDADQGREAISGHMVVALEVARHAGPRMRPEGTLRPMSGTGCRRVGHRLGIVSAATAALPASTAALALELAPVRVNLIAAGFVGDGDQVGTVRQVLPHPPSRPGPGRVRTFLAQFVGGGGRTRR